VISRSTVMAFLSSTTICFVLASIFNTQFVIAGLSSVGVNVPINDRLIMTGQDLLGLAPTYGILISIGLAIAFFVMRQVVSRLGHPHVFFGLGGALCFVVMIAAMEPILGITLVTSARTLLGWGFQCFAGAIAGWLFAKLYTK